MPSEQAIRQDWIPAFLHYGYRPWGDFRMEGPWNTEKATRRAELARLSEAELVDEGVKLMRSAFACREAGDHVIPLSGGLDSRAILGVLLDTVGRSQIRTVTFGTPGTLDFEIGRSVAKAAGVSWEGIDVRSVPWSTRALVEFTAQYDHPFDMLNTYLYAQLRRCLKPRSIVWGGFLGGPLGGGRYCPAQPAAEWTQACALFAADEGRLREMRLAPPGFDPASVLPGVPFLPIDRLNYEDQLNFFLRQTYWMLPNNVLNGHILRMPFLHTDWVMFMLCIPHAQRYHKAIYKRVLRTAFPRLFSIGIKTHRGLPVDAPAWAVAWRRLAIKLWKAPRRIIPSWPLGADPMLNTMDFESAIRARPDLRAVVDENIGDLARRGIIDWLDVTRVWAEHRRGRANHTDALLLLLSLELFLKSAPQRAARAQGAGAA